MVLRSASWEPAHRPIKPVTIQTKLIATSAELDAITDFPDRAEPATVHALGLTDFVASVAITGPKNRPDLEA